MSSQNIMLTSEAIHSHMENVIQDVNPRLKDSGWRLRRVVLAKDDAGSDGSQDSVMVWSQLHAGTDSSLVGNPAHYYGMVLTKITNTSNPASSGESSAKETLLISFYLSYSTWDGRCLHVDQLPRDEKDCPVAPVFLLQTLGQIAIQLGCRRLLWMQTGDPSWSFVTSPSKDGDSSNAIVKPETLEEWLMLKMDRKAMESYAGTTSSQDGTSSKAPSSAEPLDRSTIEAKIQQVCTDLQTSSSSSLQLRLVTQQGNIQQDAESIYKLVKGLAEYEKEPDAVQCSASDYEVDASGSHPLFYCLLLEDMTTNATCGMAFIYFGYSLGGGRFLYLEDLYLEPAFRRMGGGSLTLKSLANIGIALDCSYLLWTALDWNQPALNLYSKMGAIVQDGLRISRYKDEELIRFAKASVPVLTIK